MSNIVKINETDLQVIEYQGRRVATHAQIDTVHQRPTGTAGRNFREHKHRLIEGEDFIAVGADEFRRHLDPSHSKFASEDVMLMTEQGYLMLVKSFTDDLAWQVQRQVVTGYFRANEAAALTKPKQDQSGLPEFRRARALDLATKTAERITSQFPNLSENSRQVIFAKVINPVAGFEILALPRVEKKHRTAGEVGEILGITGTMVGRIANLHNLKTPEHGEYHLDKSRHSDKQVESWVYNDKGVEAVRQHMASSGPRLAASDGAADGRAA